VAENKTKPTKVTTAEFLAEIADPGRRADCEALIEMMERLSGDPAVMWGKIVGFGTYHYRYESGREGDFLRVGFASRAKDLTLYIMAGFDRYPEIIARLGKFKTGKSCLYVKRLADVDKPALEELVTASLDYMRKTYG
jgi:hypothetical protein